LAGCLVIGLIAGISGKSELMSTEMRLLLATGFCGGLVTLENIRVIHYVPEKGV
jgi:CrcB protein